MVALQISLLVLMLITSSSSAQRNITQGSSLTTQGTNTSWLSPSGDFAFGFRPMNTSASSYLLALWFDKTIDKTVIWYAKDRTQGVPVEAPSGSLLQLTSDGALSLRDPANLELWNPQVVGAVYANMLDTGDFVLTDAGGSITWDTFINPADTILPNQVLRRGMELHSRLMATDYTDGRFLLSVQDDGNLVFYPVAAPSGNKYSAYWSSDTVGNGSQLVFNTSGKIYFTLTNGTKINITSVEMSSMADYYHRATLDPDGVFRQYIYPKTAAARSRWDVGWTAIDFIPRNICDIVVTGEGSGVCGFNSYCRFDWNRNQTVDCQCPPQYSFIDPEREYKGCQADFQPQSCELDETAASDQFDLLSMIDVDWPLADYEHYYTIDEDYCKKLCMMDCFCAVTVFHQGHCWKKKLPLSNGRADSTVQRTLYLKVPKNSSSQSQLNSDTNKWKKDKKYWVLGSSLLLGSSVLVNLLLISFILFGTYCFVSRKKTILPKQLSSTGGLPLKYFTYKELDMATGGFHEEVGRGGSGVVYKGELQDELTTRIAVKKIDKVLSDTEKEFAVEVQTIGYTFHKNLVRLLGYCNEGTERLLVYEFMTNGSLTRFLFSSTRPSWYLRVQFALGVARGLLYLHEECSTQIIHCDIKPENILLDDNLVPKISDFGLAKLLRMDQTQTNTGIRGTRGYVAPEWFKNIGITAKVDVYSFGVILLELISCRRNVEQKIPDEDRTILTDWANDCYRSGCIDLLVESDEEASLDMKRVQRFVAVALWCIQEEPAMRPTMHKVTQMLDGAVEIPVPPDPASYISSIQ